MPVVLSAGNATAYSATGEPIALVECLSDTLNKLIVDAYAFAEANKSDLETQDADAEGSAACVDEKDHQK